ncbi:MAG: sigma-54-dependent Fis family transcriptional regulator [Planctomycetes bacterium]|nr:sigma-54-dependent Fis family transcriptional regulator [Planctomycetota bacterium]
MDEVTRQIGADRGTLYLVDHARGELVSRIAHLPELAEIRLRIGEGVAGSVASTGEVVMIAAGEVDSRFSARIDEATGYQTTSMLVVPARDAEGQVIAVLQLLNKQQGDFGAGDRSLLTELACELAELLAETSLRSQLRPEQRQGLAFRFNNIVGESRAMRAVFDRTTRAARTEATVLVRGESGSGKEAIARAVHFNSPRREQPLVKVDCAALPHDLIENELFGHVKGAYTGADSEALGKVDAASGGTLFLDEIGELPLSVQGKLLRLLQEKTFLRVGGTEAVKVDLRFVCATHLNLEEAVAERRFREDLYYRLKVVQIEMPPLRDRGAADLDRLIDHFWYEITRRHARPELSLTRSARARLHGHDWPGNVRELEHALESAIVLSPDRAVGPEQFSLGGPAPRAAREAADPNVFSTPLLPLHEVERAYVVFALELHEGNKSAASRTLEISRNTLQRKLE